MTIEEAKQYIQSVRWQYAKTYVTAPHEYTVLDWAPETQQKMIDFANFILDNGHKEKFYSKKFTVLEIDDMKYWSMDFPTNNTNLINRTFVDDNRKNKIIDFVKSEHFIHHTGMSLYDVEKDMNNEFGSFSTAHHASFKNMDSLLNDTLCGCFYCLRIFSPKEIVEVIEEKDGLETALCPYCGVDSVIGKASGFPITRTFLADMFGLWFGRTSSYEEN